MSELTFTETDETLEVVRIIHRNFNASDADVILQSSDHVQFKLHRKYLEAYTGAFPGQDAREVLSSAASDADDTPLTEPARVLEILFEFVYPKRHPSLDGLSFEVLAPLAEAVEKYEVFSAMTICELRLRPFISEHAHEILVHGIKHDYPLLINEAARQLCRDHRPLHQFLAKIPSNAIFPWIRYSEAWKSIFERAIHSTGIHHPHEAPEAPLDVPCGGCQSLIVAFIVKLERMPGIPALNVRLEAGFGGEKVKITGNCRSCPQTKTGIKSLERAINICRSGIAAMKDFTYYLSEPLM